MSKILIIMKIMSKIRYNDVNKNKLVPLQLKTNNFSFGELDVTSIDDTADIDIGSNGYIFFIKCREILN